MPSSSVYIRLFGKVVALGGTLEELAYWKLLPVDQRESFKRGEFPPLWWLVGVCDQMGVPVHDILLGTESQLLAPVLREVSKASRLKEIRAMNTIADREAWSWTKRVQATTVSGMIEGREAARASSPAKKGPTTLAYWKKIGLGIDLPPQSSTQVTDVPVGPEIDLSTCAKHDSVFPGFACSRCGLGEYTRELE